MGESFDIAVDTGGTFTDCIGTRPDGAEVRLKVLSKGALRGEVRSQVSEVAYRIDQKWGVTKDIFKGYTFRSLCSPDVMCEVAGFDSARRLLFLCTPPPPKRSILGRFELSAGEDATILGVRLMTETPLDRPIPETTLRLGTTRGTNALLERRGADMVFIVTQGFRDLLAIGTQARPDIFSLGIEKPTPLTTNIVEADERIAADGGVLRPIDIDALRRELIPFREAGIDVAAVALVNAYRNPSHENQVRRLLEEMGVSYISVSHRLSRRISYLARCRTSQVNAYLSPVIQDYLEHIGRSGVEKIYVMSSAGGLVPCRDFSPQESLLSGPAGGCIGMAAAGKAFGFSKLIGFDMGGTSTDVSRFDEAFDYTFELSVGDGEILTRALDIETVAAGGGSICWFDGYKLRVGPKSAGADPGPACYGAGGPLCITDINLLAGKLDPALFGIPVDPASAEAALLALIDDIEAAGQKRPSEKAIIEGFLGVADEIMAGAVKTISAEKGFDTAAYVMVAFGGAGGLHACSVSDRLGIEQVLLPGDAGILSASGLGQARLEQCAESQVLLPLERFEACKNDIVSNLREEALTALRKETGEAGRFDIATQSFCRFKGRSSSLPVNGVDRIHERFEQAYTALFGHWHDTAEIEVEAVRLTARAAEEETPTHSVPSPGALAAPSRKTGQGVPVFIRDDLLVGEVMSGPALLLDQFSASYIETGWQGIMGEGGSVILTRVESETRPQTWTDQAALSLYANRFMFIADTMGATLRRTAASVNVKERLDFSTAILDAEGRLVAGAHHIPVHLGALGVAVHRVIAQYPLAEGDVMVTNHPAFGGSHLPDITVISPVYVDGRLLAYVASRAHHAELGGKCPGSMPPDARRLSEEGVVIPPLYLCQGGVWAFEQLAALLQEGPYPSRAPEDNLADIRAQVAANLKGARDLEQLVQDAGPTRIARYIDLLRQNAACEAASMLAAYPTEMTATEYLDDGTPLTVTVRTRDGSAWEVDWQGSGSTHSGNLNGTEAVVTSVVMYVIRLLLNKNVPLNHGLLANIRILGGGIVSPPFSLGGDACPAVSGGNTELSQRMTDALLKAFDVLAASQGTMNNLLFGNERFGYYETIGGGAGAGPGFAGAGGVHTHMTNTRITDVEIIERRYPVRVVRFALRPGSGGRGAYPGGDGVVREMEMLAPLTVSFVAERRASGPYGRAGGGAGSPGSQWIIRKGGRVEPMPGRATRILAAGDRIVIETPGGGAWGER